MRRLKAVPWIAVLAALKVAIDYWSSIGKKDRKRAIDTLKASKGLPNRMTPAQKESLKHIARQMRPIHLAYDVTRTVSPVPMPDLTGQKHKQRRTGS